MPRYYDVYACDQEQSEGPYWAPMAPIDGAQSVARLTPDERHEVAMPAFERPLSSDFHCNGSAAGDGIRVAGTEASA